MKTTSFGRLSYVENKPEEYLRYTVTVQTEIDVISTDFNNAVAIAKRILKDMGYPSDVLNVKVNERVPRF